MRPDNKGLVSPVAWVLNLVLELGLGLGSGRIHTFRRTVINGGRLGFISYVTRSSVS